MLNVLFVLYNDFTTNSAVHVFNLANALSEFGCDCAVAVPSGKPTLNALGKARFRAVEFDEVRGGNWLFSNGRGPDIVHAWTPRENVRQFCEEIQKRSNALQFVHLEDNEWYITAKMLNRDLAELSSLSECELDHLVPAHLCHPRRAVRFLQKASGVTVIIDRLKEFVPDNVPRVELWPSADPNLFFPRPVDYHQRSKLIGLNRIMLAYTGNVHAANAAEVRSIYLATAILNREGHPTTLVRTGRDYFPFLGQDESWARSYSVELGFVPYSQIPDVLALSDILIQPGKPDAFNDYRFPSKLPEFLAMGRPVVLPATNLALSMRHGQDAYVLPRADALAITDAVKAITGDRALRERLAKGARAFYDQHLSWQRSATSLLAFYQSIVASRTPERLVAANF